MATTITIDPVTRIEGHLKIEITAECVAGVSRSSTREPPVRCSADSRRC